MILSITLASVVFALLDDAARAEPEKGPATALITLIIVAALTLRGWPMLRLWGPVIGIVAGCITAAALGIYDFDPVSARPLGGPAPSVARLWPAPGYPLLDSPAFVPFSRGDYFDPDQWRVHCPPAGGPARFPGGGFPPGPGRHGRYRCLQFAGQHLRRGSQCHKPRRRVFYRNHRHGFPPGGLSYRPGLHPRCFFHQKSPPSWALSRPRW